LVDVFASGETVPGTAYVVGVVVVGVGAVVANVPVEAVADVVPGVVTEVAVVDEALWATAMQPVSSTIPLTLTVPAILRARCAGCGRRPRVAGGGAGRMLTPFDRASDQHRACR
jgi:hypothetical protein